LPKKKVAQKGILFFLPALPKKGKQARKQQATQDCPKDRLKSEHRDCWGELQVPWNKRNLTVKIFVKVKPKAKETKIEKVDENQFQIWVKEAPHKGKANKALIEIIAEYFNVPKSKVKIVSGVASRQKCIEIL
jgi:hypothetical protein